MNVNRFRTIRKAMALSYLNISLISLSLLILQVSCTLENSSSGKLDPEATNLVTTTRTTKLQYGIKPMDDMEASLHIAQCRASCLEEYNNEEEVKFSCMDNQDCFSCWRSCKVLESNWSNKNDKTSSSTRSSGGTASGSRTESIGAICLHSRSCLNGCQTACKFYDSLTEKAIKSTEPVLATKRESVLRVNVTNGKLRWPAKAKAVYVVLQENRKGSWKEIMQTTNTEVYIPKGLPFYYNQKLKSIRIFIINSRGLMAIYYPTQTTPVPSRESQLLMDFTTTTVQTQPIPDWNLRKVSLIHQKFLVIAELTWNPYPDVKEYLITWELDGGGLKGHLVTDTTSVSLSLWPNTLYHIQVEIFGKEDPSLLKKSFSLAVDTSEASFPMEQEEHQPLPQVQSAPRTESSHKSVTGFLNATLILTLSTFLILVCLTLGIVLRRLRRSRDPKLLQNIEEPETDIESKYMQSLPASKILSGKKYIDEKKDNKCLSIGQIHQNCTNSSSSDIPFTIFSNYNFDYYSTKDYISNYPLHSQCT